MDRRDEILDARLRAALSRAYETLQTAPPLRRRDPFRPRPRRSRAILAATLAITIVLGMTGVAVAFGALHPRTIGSTRPAGEADSPSPSPSATSTGTSPVTSARPLPSPDGRTTPAAALRCAAGANGGATDVGVYAGAIDLASTVVGSGPTQNQLGPARYGIQAVVDRVNRAGGICGRRLILMLKDDGGDASTGKTYIDNFIQSSHFFALAVAPSPEGLLAASQAGDIDRAGIPVVGVNGMQFGDHRDPWLWPVAASDINAARVMAHNAIAGGADKLGVVYDETYRVNFEAAGAFISEAQREGHQVPQECRVALRAGQPDYAAQVRQFDDSCAAASKGVDFVALLLQPQTAQTWIGDAPYLGTRPDGSGHGAGAAQELSTPQFLDSCGQPCTNLALFASIYPAASPFDQVPEVQAYRQDLCAVDTDCAVHAGNLNVEAAYSGMDLLVQALQATGPNLTRARLRSTLDSMELRSRLSLHFSAPGVGGGRSMRALLPVFQSSQSLTGTTFQFTGFRYADSRAESDPCPNCADPPP